MATLYIDNRPYEVKEGKNLLEICLSLGIDLPYFCWHPAMGSVGACRQCAIRVFKDENDSNGRLAMACMEPVNNELRISVDHPTAKAFRKQLIEWLMTNHPHDCAVCDEGGSCHLQDMTVMTGHNYRRFEFPKRTYTNQYLGPLINHEMNRCIQCYRCVRFYKDYAGGNDLDVFAAHNHVYFGRAEDGVLQSEFSGNLAEVCPTGVFTDKTLKQHYTRKWDFTFAPSICQHCSLGCNIIAGERYGELRQITSRYNSEVNGYFMCDRGRFGYEAANSDQRIQQAAIKTHHYPIDKKILLDHISELLIKHQFIGIGSPRASLESNYALMKLVGKEHFFNGISETEHQLNTTALALLQSGVAHIPSLKEIEEYDVVLILGEDIINSAPMAALSVRQAIRQVPIDTAHNAINLPVWHDAALREYIQNKHSALFIAHPYETKLDDIATKTHYLTPTEIAALGYAITQHINNGSLSEHSFNEEASLIASELLKAERPLIIAGTSLMNEPTLKAAGNIAMALTKNGKTAGLFLIMQECNSLGLTMMQSTSLNEALAKTNEEDFAVIILENDIYRRVPAEHIDLFLTKCSEVITIDHQYTKLAESSTVIIPSGFFSEADGTIINNEGRAQRYFQVFTPENPMIRESWRWLTDMYSLKNGIAINDALSLNDLQRELIESLPQFKGVEKTAPEDSFRVNGQKIPREPHRYSGRTAMQANKNVSEPKPPEDLDSSLSFTMEGYQGIPPSSLTPFFWSPGWNSVQSINKFQIEIGGPLHDGDPGVRLIEPLINTSASFITSSSEEEKKSNDWTVVPIHHIFGSEELSNLSAPIAELSPAPYVALNETDLKELGLNPTDRLIITLNNNDFELPIQLKYGLPPKTVGIPYGLKDFAINPFPINCIVRKK
ncbi:NADH-quinone oxidoreductase subunit G [compost metagenome]